MVVATEWDLEDRLGLGIGSLKVLNATRLVAILTDLRGLGLGALV